MGDRIRLSTATEQTKKTPKKNHVSSAGVRNVTHVNRRIDQFRHLNHYTLRFQPALYACQSPGCVGGWVGGGVCWVLCGPCAQMIVCVVYRFARAKSCIVWLGG